MTIVFTGGGTGGHFYPIIAIAEAISDLVREKRLIAPKLYYLAPTAFDATALFENGIVYVAIPAGKMRRYSSWRNVTDFFSTFAGTLGALYALFRIYPDVVVSKGGYGSVPTVLAAWLLRIPIIIHESDSRPGRANLLGAKFATKIAIAFESSAALFPKKVQSKIARTGIPIRKALTRVETEGAMQYLGLEPEVPTAFIIGGSQGAQRLNEVVLTALPDLVAKVNVIHQTGRANISSVQAVADVVLAQSPHASRYHAVDYLSEISLQRAAGAASVVVTRAGANALAELALWKRPGIVIPIPETVSHDQRSNAYAYARTGAAVVIEEQNLTPHLLVSEIVRIVSDPELSRTMAQSASGFTDPDAARVLASQILAIALSHDL